MSTRAGEPDALGAAASDSARRAEARFRTALEAMIDGVLIYSTIRDADGVIVDFRCEYANRSVVANRGVAPEDQVGRTMLEVFPHISEPEVFAQYANVVETGEPLVRDIPWFEDDRVAGSFEIHASRLGDGIVVVLRDVTERREMEAALQTSEARWREYLDAIPAGVVVVDASGPVFMNASAQELAGQGLAPGITPEQLPSHFQLFRAETGLPYPLAELPLRRALREGVSVGARDVVIRREDCEVPIDSFATPLRDASGEVVAAITVFGDSTGRRAAERQLEAALEERRQAHRDLSDFASHVAHDLAAPARGIAGFAELLQGRESERFDEESRRWLELIVEETAQMRSLIDELLLYAQAGSRPFARRVVDLTRVVAATRDQLRPRLVETKGALIARALPNVVGDPIQIARVIQNLVDNGLKFSRPGVAPEVVVDAVRLGELWQIRVADNGVGVSAEDREQIFAPFARPANSGAQGSGLGLAICRRIVERHGGSIWAETVRGPGMRICFTLPAAETGASTRTGDASPPQR